MSSSDTASAVATARRGTARRPRWPVRGIAANIAVGVLLLYVAAALVGTHLLPYGPNELGAGPRLQTPSAAHWLGTDALGRDQFARVVAAIRPALEAALFAVAFAIVVGTAIGIVAGFFGRVWDGVLSRVVDLLFAVPEYLLAILVLAVMGRGLVNASLAIGLIIIPRFARIARGATIEIAGRSYVDAARLCGRSRWWIMRRHILPNISSPLAIMAAINLSTVEGAYAALSFLGFGVRPPHADFGSMIASAQQYLLTDPWLVAYPSIAFVVLVLAFIFLGDAMRDHLDPRSRTSAGA
ncbi:peptide/nickel transport system permease protein [Micromonospora viridifaciens]|uniref:Peptide/nickel transport system permease protein n=1 Tax=Micromonospora viridifaciens TaxID=1881 RepID=A0A1C4WSJ6_MICVI|nr:ABC transporter permease [Micromonospora viridifaciens]SCE99129.1 peptide/nickel transport system permease protein [Micromonospora viridifaciens]